MIAISLWNPWATLLAGGMKEYETRSWHPASRGVRLPATVAIHAAVRWDKTLAGLSMQRPYRECLAALGFELPMPLDDRLVVRTAKNGVRNRLVRCPMPLGAVVGVGVIAEASSTGKYLGEPEPWVERLSGRERAFGDFTPGRYGWRFLDAAMLPEPVATPGRQGFWALPADVEAAVRAQLDRAGLAGVA